MVDDRSTCIVPRTNITEDSRIRLDSAVEKQCQNVFDEKEPSVPKCFVVLPYELQLDGFTKMLVAPTSFDIETAVQIGKCLLDINKSTARLSFWLMMKKALGDVVPGEEGGDSSAFKEKLKSWLRQARSECTKSIASEMVDEIDCGAEYIYICRELLEKETNVSNAKAYIEDPLAAAEKEIRKATDLLLKSYSTDTHFFYLIDEFQGVPISSSEEEGSGIDSAIYPLRIDANLRMTKTVFLPFMNISAMIATARCDDMASLAKYLGLPLSYGIPNRWKRAREGLIHQHDQISSVAAFALLQCTIREVEQSTSRRGSNSRGRESISEIEQLVKFYKSHDPGRNFSGLCCVSDGHDRAPLWTSSAVVDRLDKEAMLTHAELRLNELEKERSKRDEFDDEIENLANKVISLRKLGGSSRSVLTQLTELTATSSSSKASTLTTSTLNSRSTLSSRSTLNSRMTSSTTSSHITNSSGDNDSITCGSSVSSSGSRSRRKLLMKK